MNSVEYCDQRRYTGTAFPAPAIEVNQSGGDDQEGERDDCVGQDLEPFEPGQSIGTR